MARWNWGGAAVGLLSGVEGAAKAHEKRLQDLEDRRIADERETRRQEAMLAKQVFLANHQADLQLKRDDKVFERNTAAGIEKEKRDDKRWEWQHNKALEGKRQDMETAHGYNVALQEMTIDAAAAKGGTLKQNYEDLISIGFEPEVAKELSSVALQTKGVLNDAEARRLYNEAYTKAYTAAMQGVVSASPQMQTDTEKKAHMYAAQLTGFDLYGVLSGSPPPAAGLLSEAAGKGDAPEKRKPISAFGK